MDLCFRKAKAGSSKNNNKIKIDKLFPEEMEPKKVKSKNKLLALPSGKIRNSTMNKKKRKIKSKTKKANKAIKRDVTFLFDELIKEAASGDQESPEYTDVGQSSSSSEYGTDLGSENSSESNTTRKALAISKTTNFELNEIYQAIDNINKICLDPIKVKIKKDYIKSKNMGKKSENKDDIRYSADINIVLSNRNEDCPENNDPNHASTIKDAPDSNDFSVMVESISDTSKSETVVGSFNGFNLCDINKQISNITKDSVRTLDQLSLPSNTSVDNVELGKTNNLSEDESVGSVNKFHSQFDKNNHDEPTIPYSVNNQLSFMCNASNNTGKPLSYDDGGAPHTYSDNAHNNPREITVYDEDRPYYGRTLFYRVRGPPQTYFSPSNHCNFKYNQHFTVDDPRSLSPHQLGFDSAQSLNNSLNAVSEIIIKPPVTIGKSISFRSNISKCILSKDKFISDSVFQINWFNPKTIKRKRSLLKC